MTLPEMEGFHQSVSQLDGLVHWRISGFLHDEVISEAKQTLHKILAKSPVTSESGTPIAAGQGPQIILDFEGMRGIDSRGLGFLVSVQKEARIRSGRLVMVHLTAQFAALLELTKLNRIFEIFLDLETARRSFGGTHLQT
jgi:anti-anti-sigma factor